jgi:hypothetical protein
VKFSIYLAPKARTLFSIWSQRSTEYRHGFVMRILWLGIVFRYGRN